MSTQGPKDLGHVGCKIGAAVGAPVSWMSASAARAESSSDSRRSWWPDKRSKDGEQSAKSGWGVS
jgi:hypothetical protein